MIKIDKKDLREFCEDFVKDSLTLCKSLNDIEPVTDYSDYYPKFMNNRFDDVYSKKVKNFKKFVYQNEDKLISQESYILLNTYLSEQKPLKQFFQNIHQISEAKSKNIEEDTKELLLILLLYYLETNGNFEFVFKIFNVIFKEFFNYVDHTMNTVQFYTPLYNLDLTKKELKFDDITLRQISEDQFKAITRLGSGPGQQNTIHPDFVNLQYVLELEIPRKNNFREENVEASDKFAKFVQAMKLSYRGDVLLGTLYRNYTNPWLRSGRYVDGNEPDFFSNNRLKIPLKSYASFKTFYKKFKELDLSKSELRFLKVSIQRFESAIIKKNFEDKIVDFMISLESMYTSGPGETRMKMSNRIATLLGDSESDKENFWFFIDAAYNLRSGIVHGEGIRTKKIREREYSLEEISIELEEITRISLRRFLSLIKFYAGKKINEKIIDDIDLGLINRDKLAVLQKNSKTEFV